MEEGVKKPSPYWVKISSLKPDDVTLHYQMSRLLVKKLSIIRSLDPRKAHGCDDLSINMIKICDTEIVKPFQNLCKNQLLTPNQFSFHPGHSTVNQLLSITHKIYSAFEEFPFKRNKGCLLRYI